MRVDQDGTEIATKFFGGLLGIIIVCALAYGGWLIKREWNSFWYYDSATIEVICETVKPEYIKDGICQ